MEGEDLEDVMKRHLGWSEKQTRILTGGGRADVLYTADRGFPFETTELPHHHLLQGDTQSVFRDWKTTATPGAGSKRSREEEDVPIAGAWTRLLFFGGWEHTSIKDERTFNLQTNNLFIDLRIPRTREAVIAPGKTSLQDLSKEELRFYARQHVFAGYTRVDKGTKQFEKDLVCTRHHCIDWNFVGTPRSRPNKWYAELQPATTNNSDVVRTWKEWTFATDERGQHYYCEQWDRLADGAAASMVALRRKKRNGKDDQRDGIILIVGDHFNYILGRDLSAISVEKQQEYTQNCSSLVAIVDAALHQDDLDAARAFLSIQGGHGRISKGWNIDCAIEPWKEGTALWTQADKLLLTGEDAKSNSCEFTWNGQAWELFDTNLSSAADVKKLLTGNRNLPSEPTGLSLSVGTFRIPILATLLLAGGGCVVYVGGRLLLHLPLDGSVRLLLRGGGLLLGGNGFLRATGCLLTSITSAGGASKALVSAPSETTSSSVVGSKAGNSFSSVVSSSSVLNTSEGPSSASKHLDMSWDLDSSKSDVIGRSRSAILSLGFNAIKSWDWVCSKSGGSSSLYLVKELSDTALGQSLHSSAHGESSGGG
ncbi:expressed unknown protein [Seminavis robusta]|uniref:Uncharacterized protein n=1 Tax=Seminavis robusta TaxID=568900 RepID=A0A9N8EB69_9STRA|nr:expressed unknown protein [Seminavis robusta]|eukprot:Sro753_g197400.1 n/a (594) ;mRNA; r:30235-32171